MHALQRDRHQSGGMHAIEERHWIEAVMRHRIIVEAVVFGLQIGDRQPTARDETFVSLR
jgi:hypothetical protein